MLRGEVTTSCKMLDKIIMGQLPCLRQSVHSFCNLAMDGVVVDFGFEIVFVNDVGGGKADWDCDVLGFSKSCA